jgi:diaminohydroxyphosphoribosylaminopyrimidine deaminase/5-amino-6-(5-phosphoribosylamino)uracil reductase
MIDPNPKVAGSGVAILEAQGVKVDVGLLEKEAEQLNLGFIKRMKTQLPRVTVKLASSLDGKTALKNGESKWITGPSARVDVQYYRAQQSAILSGVDTVIMDDASLNVRFSELQKSSSFNNEITDSQVRQPLRIILDSHNRLTLKEKIFTLEGEVLIVSLTARNDLNSTPLNATTTQYIASKNREGRIDIKALLSELGKREINDLWIEAGATLSGEFFSKNSVDQFILYQAAKLMGDQAKNLVNLPNFSTMNDVVLLSLQNIKQIEQDLRLIFSRD